jgi:hypothetical protein
MYKAEISNKNGEAKIVDCREENSVYSALRELEIDSWMRKLKIGDNEDGETIKLVADNDFDAAITKILTDNRDTLYDAVLVAKQLNGIKDDAIKEEIERNAINEQYETKENLYNDIRKTKIEFSSVREDFYCPLHVRSHDADGYDIDIEQEDIVQFEEAICERLEAEQEDDEMTPYVGEQADIEDKLLYAEWTVENRNGNLYGKISCYFRESITEKETERLKDTITGQNSDGFGESFEQHPVRVDSDDIYVSFWDDKDYFLKTSSEMDEYLQKNDIKIEGI